MSKLNTPAEENLLDDVLKPKRKLCCGDLRVILNYMIAE
jgi:hypothetical protein